MSRALSSARRRALVVHGASELTGGGAAVAAWTLQALKEQYDVSVLTWGPIDLARLNRFYGTGFAGEEVRRYNFSAGFRRGIESAPLPLELLRRAFFCRRVRQLQRRDRYDVVISTCDELDFGCLGLQYVHFPWSHMPLPLQNAHWYHRLPGAGRLYVAACCRLGPLSFSAASRNVTLVNSRWTAAKFRELIGRDPERIVYPPVPGDVAGLPWEDRGDEFVCIGRIASYKRQDEIIRILAGVRQRGRQVSLHIVGSIDDSEYAERLREQARAHGDWVQLYYDAPRDEIVRLARRARYGIHAMRGEHFGIAVAELERAGCVVFVSDDGGPLEIVEGDDRVIFGSLQEAVDKIDSVLGDTRLQRALHAAVAGRKDRFSTERFMAEMREAVEALVLQ